MAEEPFPFNFVNSALAVDTDLVLSVVLRTVTVTIFVLFAIRWMGHKGLGQLSMYELIILIGLGWLWAIRCFIEMFRCRRHLPQY